MLSNDLLRRDIRTLGDMLGETIQELAGPAAFALVEEIRRLSRERRSGNVNADAALAKMIEKMSEEDARNVGRAFSIFFDMANLAEDRHRIRVLRERELERYPEPLSESIPAAIAQMKKLGMRGDEVQKALDRLKVELVFTAHPSEAKRRCIRAKLRRMRRALETLERTDLLPRERDQLMASLRTELLVIWQTEFLRPLKPTVLDEVERGISVMPRLFEVVPQICASLRRALRTYYPHDTIREPQFLQFGSWMGGDRDGNPFVTSEITAKTLLRLRDYVITEHLAFCKRMTDYVTVSSREAEIDAILTERVEAAAAAWPELAPALERVAPSEVYRRWVAVIQWRLTQSRVTSFTDPLKTGAYRDGRELAADLELIAGSLAAHHGEALLESEVQRWLDVTRVFGLHLTRLDIRQDARRYQEIMQEIFATTGLAEDYAGLDEAAKLELLGRTMSFAGEIPLDKLAPLSVDTLKLFRILQQAIQQFGPDCIGGHITSLTRSASDVLCVLWLWRWAQAAAARETGVAAPTDSELRIAPLFEKIDDLAKASQTLYAMLDQPHYADHLKRHANRQMVMVGYSDSTKDGGYLAACWGLYRGQAALHEAAAARGVKLTFFHGRGGSLGRGGGPAARGILSLPQEAQDGTLRLTEQGEVLAERYDDVQVAYRHLEQVTWATLVASSLPLAPVKPIWLKVMDAISAKSLVAYRELVDQKGFIAFFAESTPIDEIENLPIGSRPARRRGERTLDDLRAIPWVFSWTQNRCMIPAWYGLGAALDDLRNNDRAGWATVCEMYRDWSFLQATIDNATLALAKADMNIAQRYAALSEDPEARQRLWTLIASEHERSRRTVLDIVGGDELLSDLPWFRASIEARNPYIDPLNLIQIEMLKRRRRIEHEADKTTEQESLRYLLRLSVQGIAAGMRTTG